MTGPHLPLEEPTTPEEFHDALRWVVYAAQANDVDVRGGWSVGRREGRGGPCVDIEVTEVAEQSSITEDE